MSAEPVNAASPGPVRTGQRITALDTIRGVAILGILPMNALSFGLDRAAYANVSADGIAGPLDWIVGLATMLLIDQKMMALFSLLFGVGVVIFAERARAKGRRVIWLSLWRFALLAVVGLVHALFWEGDILLLYALCAPLVLLMRRLPAGLLAVLGVAIALAGTALAPSTQAAIGDDTAQLGEYWLAESGPMSTTVEDWFLLDAAGRALGLMLLGVALYRWELIQGTRPAAFYRRLAVAGLVTGALVTGAGLVFRLVDDWAADHALVGHVPTGLGTIPLAVGYLALIALWNQGTSVHLDRFRNAGRMALTNYLTQTVLGLVILGWLLDGVELTRTMIAVWILGVWALQLWWSSWWLERYRFGPFEWAWRCATYRRWQPLAREPAR